MFRGLFKKHTDEDIFEVDPVVEKRRIEKFSTPLIYDDEFKEDVVEEVKEVKEVREVEKIDKPVAPAKKKTPVKVAKPIVSPPSEKPKSTYKMKEIISPINGLTQKAQTEKPEKIAVKKPKKKKNVDQLVPVFSPYFGNYEKKEVIESEATLTSIEEEPILETPQTDLNKVETVEDNLRHLANIVKEEKDQLKIIEERTGEFKLDFNTNDVEKQNTLIEEIDDNMSLDELMSLYEKKFKD